MYSHTEIVSHTESYNLSLTYGYLFKYSHSSISRDYIIFSSSKNFTSSFLSVYQ